MCQELGTPVWGQPVFYGTVNMASIAKRTKLGSAGSPVKIFGVVALLGIGALFISPDLAGLIGLSDLFGRKGVISEAVENTASLLTAEEPSPLGDVLNDLKAKEEEEQAAADAIESKIWSMIGKGPAHKALVKARKQVLKLSEQLRPNQRAAFNSMQAYAVGIEKVLKKTNPELRGSAIPKYIEMLDERVTEALVADNVAQSIRLRWSEVSVGEDLQSVIAAARKQDIVGPFDPEFRLVKVKMRQLYNHHGVWDPDAKVGLKFHATVYGDHVERIEAYRDGEYIMDLKLAAKVDNYGKRIVKFRQWNNVRDSIYTFKIYDEQGRLYERSYTFYPRVTQFHWNGKTNAQFVMPWEPFDPRLDKFFYLGHRKAKAQQVSFDGGGSGLERW